MRNRFEPDQVTRAGFEPGWIAVTRRVGGCYCAPERNGRPGCFLKRKAPDKSRWKAGQKTPGPGRKSGAGKARIPSNAQAMLKRTPPAC